MSLKKCNFDIDQDALAGAQVGFPLGSRTPFHQQTQMSAVGLEQASGQGEGIRFEMKLSSGMI
jgi:hypothetical protein